MPRAIDTNGKGVEGAAIGIDLSDFLTSTSDGFNKNNILIYGVRKSGKSLLAATISELWPEFDRTPVAAVEPIDLKDMAWAAFDKSPTDTLVQYRTEVGRIADLRRAFRALGRDEFFQLLPKLLGAILTEDVRYLVIDTVSEFDKLLRNWWGQNIPTSDRGKENTMAMWTKFADDHTEFRYLVNEAAEKADRRVIYLSHARAVSEQTDSSKKINEERKSEATGRGDITFDITGQSGNGYGNECSMILVTQVTRGSRNDKPSYEVLTQGNETWEGGTRFSTILKYAEAPNLKRMIREIEKYAQQRSPM